MMMMKSKTKIFAVCSLSYLIHDWRQPHSYVLSLSLSLSLSLFLNSYAQLSAMSALLVCTRPRIV